MSIPRRAALSCSFTHRTNSLRVQALPGCQIAHRLGCSVIPDPSFPYSIARAVSADGSFIVGERWEGKSDIGFRVHWDNYYNL